MLAKRIIPCLDVDRGRVVKGIQFVSLVDAGDAVEQAKRYDAEGADELTFLDITASSDKRGIVELAQALQQRGVEILSTGGTAKHLSDAGIEVTARVPHSFPDNLHNREYLRTKASKGGHLF